MRVRLTHWHVFIAAFDLSCGVVRLQDRSSRMKSGSAIPREVWMFVERTNWGKVEPGPHRGGYQSSEKLPTSWRRVIEISMIDRFVALIFSNV
jgi:hypothetical protein